MADEQEPWTQIQIASFRGETQKVKQLAEQMSNPDPFFFEDPNAPNPQGIVTQILREIKFEAFRSSKIAVFHRNYRNILSVLFLPILGL